MQLSHIGWQTWMTFSRVVLNKVNIVFRINKTTHISPSRLVVQRNVWGRDEEQKGEMCRPGAHTCPR